jgi:hypothetical protein
MTRHRPTDWKRFAGKLTDTSPEGKEFLERVIRGEEEIPEVPPPNYTGIKVTRIFMVLAGGFLVSQIGTADHIGAAIWPLLLILCMLMVAIGIMWERYP